MAAVATSQTACALELSPLQSDFVNLSHAGFGAALRKGGTAKELTTQDDAA